MAGVSNGAGIEVGSGRLGRGVFALQAFSAGDTLEVCPTLEVPDNEITGFLSDYVFQSGTDASKCILLLGYGMLYNHSTEPNAEYVEHGEQTIAFVAIRDVEPGDELTISYGDEWWETREIIPE